MRPNPFNNTDAARQRDRSPIITVSKRGRTRSSPLAWWANQRMVYDEGGAPTVTPMSAHANAALFGTVECPNPHLQPSFPMPEPTDLREYPAQVEGHRRRPRRPRQQADGGQQQDQLPARPPPRLRISVATAVTKFVEKVATLLESRGQVDAAADLTNTMRETPPKNGHDANSLLEKVLAAIDPVEPAAAPPPPPAPSPPPPPAPSPPPPPAPSPPPPPAPSPPPPPPAPPAPPAPPPSPKPSRKRRRSPSPTPKTKRQKTTAPPPQPPPQNVITVTATIHAPPTTSPDRTPPRCVTSPSSAESPSPPAPPRPPVAWYIPNQPVPNVPRTPPGEAPRIVPRPPPPPAVPGRRPRIRPSMVPYRSPPRRFDL